MKRLLITALLLTALTVVQAQNTTFARGADISWCTEMEADGQKFYNADGIETDIFALMKEIGMSAIRLRVWVNPTKYGYGAWCDKADVIVKAKRAHEQGLDLMIDFHYSDFFADPDRQDTPLEWKDYDLEQLKTAVADHTKDVLQALKDEGIEPKWVQVGNETNGGMMWENGQIDWNKSGKARYANYVSLSNAGYDAVKEILPDAYVIVHIADAFKAAGQQQECCQQCQDTRRLIQCTRHDCRDRLLFLRPSERRRSYDRPFQPDQRSPPMCRYLLLGA